MSWYWKTICNTNTSKFVFKSGLMKKLCVHLCQIGLTKTFVCIYIKVVSWEHICVRLHQSGLMKTYLCMSTTKWSHENIFVCIYTKVVSWQRFCVYYKVVSWIQFCVYLYQSGLMATYLCVSITKWSHDNVFVQIDTTMVSWKHICVFLYQSGLRRTYKMYIYIKVV